MFDNKKRKFNRAKKYFHTFALFAVALTWTVSISASVNAQSPSGIAGSYRFGGNDLDVLQLPDGKVKFYLFAEWKSPVNREVFHFGEVCQIVPLIKNTAIYDGGECRIEIKFAGRKATLAQTGSDADCGFGANVVADGIYTRRSRRVPKFEMCDF